MALNKKLIRQRGTPDNAPGSTSCEPVFWRIKVAAHICCYRRNVLWINNAVGREGEKALCYSVTVFCESLPSYKEPGVSKYPLIWTSIFFFQLFSPFMFRPSDLSVPSSWFELIFHVSVLLSFTKHAGSRNSPGLLLCCPKLVTVLLNFHLISDDCHVC